MSDSTKVMADKAFSQFMDSPLVRLTCSQVMAEPDVLHSLLRTAFDAGLTTGSMIIAAELATMMEKKNG